MALISPQQLAQFRDVGYFVTEPQWDATMLAAVSAEFDRLHAEAIAQAETKGDAKALQMARLRPFIGQAHTRSALLAQFVKSPIYVEACRLLLGPDADLYYNQVVIKPPEQGKAFAWHQDSGYVVTEPLEYLTCWTAIGRTFVENGCIWVIPGSHQWGLQPHPFSEELNSLYVEVDEKDAIPVPMAAGQVAIFSSLTLHKSGPNTSSEIRRGYVPQYHVPTLRNVKSGQSWGDRYPVLRDNQPV